MNSSTSVSQRIAARTWELDWPSLPAEPVLSGSCLASSGWWESWPDVWAASRAIEGTGSISLGSAHAYLDGLDRWTQSYRNQLTWPPTSRGFACALATALAARNPDVLAVLSCRPAGCLAMLAEHPDIEASIPEYSLGLVKGLRLLLAPPCAPAEPVVVERESSRPPRPPRPEHPAPSAEIVGWLQDLVRELASDSSPVAVKRAQTDEAFKQLRRAEGAEGNRGWFEDILFPALAALKASDVEILLDNWPPHHRFEVRDPVAFVDTPRLWAILRDAPARDVLVRRGLVDWVDSSSWSFEQRHAMLEPMFKLVRNSERMFQERLGLWQGWGGNLDQGVVLPSPGGDAFTAAPDPVSARSWFLAQNHSMWKDVLGSTHPGRSRPRP